MKLATNEFQAWEFTEEELEVASILSELQEARINTLRAEIAAQKLNLVADTTNPGAYWQQEAYLRGQIDILSHMVTASNVIKSQQSQPTKEI